MSLSGLKSAYINQLEEMRAKENAIEIPKFTTYLTIGLSTWFAALTIAAVVLLVVIYKRLHRKDDMKRPLTAHSATDEEAAIDDLVEQLAQQVVDMDAKCNSGSVSTNSSGLGQSTESLDKDILPDVHSESASPKC